MGAPLLDPSPLGWVMIWLACAVIGGVIGLIDEAIKERKNQ